MTINAVIDRAAAVWQEHRVQSAPPPYATGSPAVIAAAEAMDDAGFSRVAGEIARLLPGESAEYHAALFDALFERIDENEGVAA